MDLGIRDSRCVITGASSGIGRGLAFVLAREGVKLVLVAREREALDAVKAEIVRLGGHAPLVVTSDLSARGGPASAVEQVLQESSQVDMLVNAVGGSRRLLPEHGEDYWEEAFAINFLSARRMATLLRGALIASGRGRIVNVSGAIALNHPSASAPAKAALQSWSRGLAGELAPYGVTVNCIAPCMVNTRQTGRIFADEAAQKAFTRQNIPIGRFAEPEDIAYPIAFLLSPLASYITGITIPIDGGFLRPGL